MGHRDFTTTLIYADFAPDPSGGAVLAEQAFGGADAPKDVHHPAVCLERSGVGPRDELAVGIGPPCRSRHGDRSAGRPRCDTITVVENK